LTALNGQNHFDPPFFSYFPLLSMGLEATERAAEGFPALVRVETRLMPDLMLAWNYIS
jgi:hypothetical protein